MLSWFRNRRRRALAKEPFPEAWKKIIDDQVPYARVLPEPLREELYHHVRIFLAEKHFEGCGGFEVNEEVQLVIASQACVLLLGRETDHYQGLSTILVYESAFYADREELNEHGVVEQVDDMQAGESWELGVVVLAWKEILLGLRGYHDGYNVVIHEFAHQLDQANRDADGVPILDSPELYARWQEVFSDHYAELLRDVKRNRKTILDDYGATNPAEFFAVATESFFEESAQLKKHHPELYDTLKTYYAQDPASYWKTLKR